MFRTEAFDYINVMQKAADASWLRTEAINNNIANANTPNYKREDIDFEGQLRKALGSSKYQSMDSKVHNVRMHRLEPVRYTDHGSFSYRLDGNNVDPDQEAVELASSQMKYDGIMNCISSEFADLKAAMK